MKYVKGSTNETHGSIAASANELVVSTCLYIIMLCVILHELKCGHLHYDNSLSGCWPYDIYVLEN